MGEIKFPFPTNLYKAIFLLNKTNSWNLSIIKEADLIYLLDGDQIQFIARSEQEAEAFLAGCFLTTFSGNSLETIYKENQRK
jgi:hypothetical protein